MRQEGLVRVAIRADASPEIGLGHIRRCLSLAKELVANGTDVKLIYRDFGFDFSSFEHDAIEFVSLAARNDFIGLDGGGPPHLRWAHVNQATDVSDFVAALDQCWGGLPPDIVIVDHYAFDAEWHVSVKSVTNALIVAVDDLADRELNVDVLIDHSWSTDFEQKYLNCIDGSVEMLCGPSYALIESEYASAPRNPVFETVSSIGVFMGGTDPGCISTVVLETIQATGFRGSVEVVSTSLNPRLDALSLLIAEHANWKLSLDLPTLAGFFARHPLHIGAGGGATWERFCIGAPSILLSNALNHDAVLEPLRYLAAAEILLFGWNRQSLLSSIDNLVVNYSLRKSFSDAGRSLVDGAGVSRVCDKLLELLLIRGR